MKIFSHGVLGMNARNLKYIRTKNTGKSVSLADNKMKTKNFLSGRWIPFAETYAVITSGQELSNFSFDSIDSEYFVIKPNHGSKGQGILICRRLKNNKFSIAGEEWTEDEVRLFMTDILGGVYSLYGNHDNIIIEELLRPGKDFSKFCRHGLADIRMIVYNYVPITAMVRMPTELSGGKANLAQWGIGLGINIANGQVISFFQHKQNYTENFPEPWGFLQWSIVPFWDKILLYSSQIQFYTELGYLALDWVITKNGPKLLEINARAGLEIQNVNLVPLAKRLEQVENIKIKSPEKWVDVAKTLFGEVNSEITGKKLIHLLEKIVYRGTEIILRVDPEAQKTKITPDLKKKIIENTTLILHSGARFTFLKSPDILENSSEKNTIILGLRDLSDFLILPKISPAFSVEATSTRFSPEIISLDEKLHSLSKNVNLSAMLKATNYDAEFSKFMESHQQYNPVFEYNFPSEEKLGEITERISEIKQNISELSEKNFIKIFTDKLSEIENRVGLVIAYKNEDSEKIFYYNSRLFGTFQPKLLEQATKKILQNARHDAEKDKQILGRILSQEEIIQEIEKFFEKNAITPIPVQISSTTFSRMAAAYKNGQAHINLREWAEIRERELPAILAHEVGTHVRRYQAGVKNELHIFRSGTGNYLSDEEWLAVYNSLKYLPEWYEKNAMYFNYYLISQIDTLSFSQSVQLLQSVYPAYSLEKIFNQVTRFKRGIIHTENSLNRGNSYWKDKIYLDGYSRVSEWIHEGGDEKLLYFWKVKISDLPLVAKI